LLSHTLRSPLATPSCSFANHTAEPQSNKFVKSNVCLVKNSDVWKASWFSSQCLIYYISYLFLYSIMNISKDKAFNWYIMFLLIIHELISTIIKLILMVDYHWDPLSSTLLSQNQSNLYLQIFWKTCLILFILISNFTSRFFVWYLKFDSIKILKFTFSVHRLILDIKFIDDENRLDNNFI